MGNLHRQTTIVTLRFVNNEGKTKQRKCEKKKKKKRVDKTKEQERK